MTSSTGTGKELATIGGGSEVVAGMSWDLPGSMLSRLGVKLPRKTRRSASMASLIDAEITKPVHVAVFGIDPRQVANGARFLSLVAAHGRRLPVALLDFASGGGSLSRGFFPTTSRMVPPPTLANLIADFGQGAHPRTPRMLSIMELLASAFCIQDKLAVFSARTNDKLVGRLTNDEIHDIMEVVDYQFMVQVIHTGTTMDEAVFFTFSRVERLVLVVDLSRSSRQKLLEDFSTLWDLARSRGGAPGHDSVAWALKLIESPVIAVSDLNGENGVKLSVVVKDMQDKWEQAFGGTPTVVGVPLDKGCDNEVIALTKVQHTAAAWRRIASDVMGRAAGLIGNEGPSTRPEPPAPAPPASPDPEAPIRTRAANLPDRVGAGRAAPQGATAVTVDAEVVDEDPVQPEPQMPAVEHTYDVQDGDELWTLAETALRNYFRDREVTNPETLEYVDAVKAQPHNASSLSPETGEPIPGSTLYFPVPEMV